MDLNLLVGDSLFVYAFNDAELRRSGTMRPAQLKKRDVLEEERGKPDPLATRKGAEEILRRIVPPSETVELRTDEHQSYPRAIRRLRDRRFIHTTTSSKEARTPENPLFPVNLSDMLIRHCSANHKRETIAFSKRRQSALYRLAIWTVWRNYVKDRSENRPKGTPAQALGITTRALSVREVLARRVFPSKVKLSGWLKACYFGLIKTRAIEKCVDHGAKFAT